MDESSAFYSITKGAVVQEWPHSSPLSLPMRHYLASKGALCHVLPRLEGAHVGSEWDYSHGLDQQDLSSSYLDAFR